MNIEQVGLQLGIAGVMVYVGWKLADLLITKWSERWAQHIEAQAKAESERTHALAVGLGSIAGKVEAHALADIESHAEIREVVATFSGQLDTVIGWQERTPIGGGPNPTGTYGLKRPGTKGGG